MSSFRASCCVLALSFLIMGIALEPDALAQHSNADVARQHFIDAIRYYEQDDYTRALSSFRAAYQASPHPAVLYNMAQCQIRLGKPQEAIRLLEQYLAQQSNPPRRDEVRRMIEQLRQQPQTP